MAICTTALLATLCSFATPQQPTTTRADAQLAKLVTSSNTIVLGEIHGYTEVPLYTTSVVDAALATGEPVLLGIEVWTSEQKRVSAFLASKGTDADRQALLQGAFWRATRDGRSSKAMLQLVESTRQRIAANKPLRVLCFDQHVGERKITRDRAMADCLLAARAADQRAKHVALTSNAHARTKLGSRWNAKFVRMAHFLKTKDATLRSLNPAAQRRRLLGGLWQRRLRPPPTCWPWRTGRARRHPVCEAR